MKFEEGRLYSLLDILGGTIACDVCGIETNSALTPEMARAANPKWLFEHEGKDYCPKCRPKALTGKRRKRKT